MTVSLICQREVLNLDDFRFSIDVDPDRVPQKKKIAAAVYLYQADNDGEWGEIRFDFGKAGHNYPQSMTFTQNRPS